MQEGVVKWFNPSKGYGFVKPDDDENDVFLHISTWQQAGFTDPPQQDERVSFEVGPGRNGKPQITRIAPA